MNALLLEAPALLAVAESGTLDEVVAANEELWPLVFVVVAVVGAFVWAARQRAAPERRRRPPWPRSNEECAVYRRRPLDRAPAESIFSRDDQTTNTTEKATINL